MFLRFACFALALLIIATNLPAAELKVDIRTDYPGGNVIVEKNAGGIIELTPDLRGGKPWFYWNFAATASQPGRVKFAFNSPKIGVRGPAISLDQGKSWKWLGADCVQYIQPQKPGDKTPQQESFEYTFTSDQLQVRFAMAMPYLAEDLERFLDKNAGNPHLTTNLLTRTLKGLPVELLQVGEVGGDTKPMILTARHHACESMASYVVEGILQEAMSDSPAAVDFRRRFVLFCVPIVDKDGVQAGDQGKWRDPHDHNRDYGEGAIYPEVQAIMQLADTHQVQFGLDVHCPALRGDVHEAFYFDGISLPQVKNNVDELSNWIREERPPVLGAPLNFMKKPPATAPTSGMPNSYYMAYRRRSFLGATLEVPYSQAHCNFDADMARAYGRSLLRAWVRTNFVPTNDDSRGDNQHATLAALRTKFQPLYRGKPEVCEAMAREYLDNAGAAAHFRAEGNSMLATIRSHQKKYGEARTFALAVLNDPQATAFQQANVAVLLVQIASLDPAATKETVEASLAEFARIPYLGPEHQAKAYDYAVNFFAGQQDFSRAIFYSDKHFLFAANHEKGKSLNRVASLYDALGQQDASLAKRKEAVALLRKQLNPVPVSGAGAMMAKELFDALCALPEATADEKRAAGQIVIDHKVTPAATREQVQKALTELK